MSTLIRMNASTRRALPILTAVATATLLVPAGAGAAKQAYAPGKKAQTLNGGAGGWTASDSQEGPLGETVCVVSGVLICPTATSAYVPDGGTSGAAGDGYASTDFSVILGVAGSATSVWESKRFVYRGVNGRNPKRLKVKARLQSELTDLLALPSASASYSAEVVPAGGGSLVPAGAGAIPASADWEKLKAKVRRKDVDRGDRYSIRITSTYETGIVGVAEEGTVGWDNLKLVAQRKGRR